MGRRLILDTNILIAYERGTIDRSALDDDELAVASITIAEYRTGIELADTPEGAAARARALATIISVIDVLDYTPSHRGAPRAAARPRPPVRQPTRRARPDHRLSRRRDRQLVLSKDAEARFNDLPGVTALDV